LEGGCGFGKSPNPSGDPFFDSFFDSVDQVTEGFNVNHGMFELEVPLTESLGGGSVPDGVYDPSPAFWSASSPGSGVVVLSQNTVAIDINTGGNTVTPLAPVTVCASDVTSQFTVALTGFRFNRATGRFLQSATITKNSGPPLGGPFAIAFDGLSSN